MADEPDSIHQYLLVYDRELDRLVEQRDFIDDADSAVAEYRETERLYRDNPRMDVVLVGSDSIATVKRTHSTYFRSMTRGDLDDLVASVTPRVRAASSVR